MATQDQIRAAAFVIDTNKGEPWTAERAEQIAREALDAAAIIKPRTPPRCETCRWYDTSASMRDNEATGQCRVSPPKINKITGGAMWPFTEDGDWCASHVSDIPSDLPY